MNHSMQPMIDRICKSLGYDAMCCPLHPDETPSRAATYPVSGEHDHDSLRSKVAGWSGLRTILDDDPVLNAPQAPAVGQSKQASPGDNADEMIERLATTGFTAKSAQQRIADTIAPHLAKYSKQSTQGLGTQQLTSTNKQAAWPGVQQAHQAMQQFMPNQGQGLTASPPSPVPGAAAGSQVAAGGGVPQAGLSPNAPGAPTMLGIQQRPIGLDAPSDTRATALPGTPGHAATNVIDQRGGLDPRGLTVDGNNAAGIKKFAGLADRLMAYKTNHIDRLIRPGSEAYESFYVDRLIRAGVKRAYDASIVSSLTDAIAADRVIPFRAVNRNQLQKQAFGSPGMAAGMAEAAKGPSKPWPSPDKLSLAVRNPAPIVPKTAVPKTPTADMLHGQRVETIDNAMKAKPSGTVIHERLRNNIRRYYGGDAGFDKAVSDAQGWQAKREPGTTLDAFPKWRPEDVDRPVVTQYSDPHDNVYGTYQIPSGGISEGIKLTPPTATKLPSTREHELTHALTVGQGSKVPFSRLYPPSWGPDAALDYSTTPAELDPRLAGVKRVYTMMTGEDVNTPEAADRALQFATNPKLPAFDAPPRREHPFFNGPDSPEQIRQKLMYDNAARERARIRPQKVQIRDHIDDQTLQYINETPEVRDTVIRRMLEMVNRGQGATQVKQAFGSPELWAGVGVGAGTGALTAALGDPDAEGRKPWLSNMLTGGLVGGLAGQLYDGSPELLTGAGLGAGAGALTAAFSDPDAKGRKPWLSNTITGGLYGGLAGKLWSAASRVSAVEKEHAAAYKPTPAVPKIPATPLPKGRVVDTANHEVSVAAKDPAGFPKPGVQASHTLADNIERYYGGRAGLDKAIADAQAAQARREPNTLLDAFQKWKAEDVDRKIPTTYVSQQDLGAHRAGQTQAEWRADSFRNTPGNILVGIGDGKSNATMNSHLEHELTHALTASRISVGTPLSRVHPPKDPAVNRAWMDYATSAAELDPRIAGIKRVYTKLTGEQVNTPEAADRALRFAANPQLSAFNTKPKPPVRFRNADYPKQKLEYDKKLREWSNTRSPELQLKDHIEGSTLKYINETPAVRDTVIRRMLELVNRGQGATQPSPV